MYSSLSLRDLAFHALFLFLLIQLQDKTDLLNLLSAGC